MKDIQAIICDQDDTLTRAPATAANFYTLNVQKAVALLAGPDHPESEFILSDGFHRWHENAFSTGQCSHTAHANRFGINRADLFEKFHDFLESPHFEHDTESAPVLNTIADRTLIFTDAAIGWARRRRDGIGHQVEIMSRSCRESTGFFETMKSNSAIPWQLALQRLREKTNKDLAASQVLVIDDSHKVLVQAASLGFPVTQCLWGGIRPAAGVPSIPQVGPHIAQIFGLNQPSI